MTAGLDKLAELQPNGAHRTLAERAFAGLHEAIVTGVLAPGERLPIEDLADVLDMSPMPIREALRRLDAAGLVENIPHRGARVTELSLDDLREVYEARLALEALAIRHAAERFTDEDAELARERLAAHVASFKADDPRQIWSTHTGFHFALYEAARSRWLVRLIGPLWESSERYRFSVLPVQRTVDERRVEHERMLEACEGHRPGTAARELHDHLAFTANLIAKQMGADELFPLQGKKARTAAGA